MLAVLIAIRSRLITVALNKEGFTNEIPNKVKFLTSQFTSLFHEEIAKIFTIKFCLVNFYKFCQIKKFNNIYHDQISI